MNCKDTKLFVIIAYALTNNTKKRTNISTELQFQMTSPATMFCFLWETSTKEWAATMRTEKWSQVNMEQMILLTMVKDSFIFVNRVALSLEAPFCTQFSSWPEHNQTEELQARQIIYSKWKHSLQDVRVMRHTDVGKWPQPTGGKADASWEKWGDCKQHLDSDKLKDKAVKEYFDKALSNWNSMLQDEAVLNFDHLNKVMTKAAKATVVLQQ